MIYSLFLMLVLLRRTSFWPPSMVYISINVAHIFLQITFQLWAYEGSFHVLHQLLCPFFWHVVGTPLCCNSVLSCVPHPHMAISDSHHDVPALVGQASWSPLFLWWLSMDDVGLQVRHLVREKDDGWYIVGSQGIIQVGVRYWVEPGRSR